MTDEDVGGRGACRHHERETHDLLLDSETIVREVEPERVAPGKYSEARCNTLFMLNSNRSIRCMILLVILYLVLAVVGLSLDLGHLCINGRHRSIEKDAIHRLRGHKHRPSLTRLHSYEVNLGFGGRPKNERAIICEPIYGQQARFAFMIVANSCFAISLVLLAEHLLRMVCTGVWYFMSDSFLRNDFIIVCASSVFDGSIVLYLRPELERFESEDIDERRDTLLWCLTLCRLWRIVLLWRLVRAFYAENDVGAEFAWTMMGLKVMLCDQEGMKRTRLTKVEVIRNSPAERKTFRARMAVMRQEHGRVREQILFFGTGDVDPHNIVGHPRSLDSALSEKHDATTMRSWTAFKPVYSDSCYAFVVQNAEALRTRQLLIVKALLGKAMPDLGQSTKLDSDGNKYDYVHLKSLAPPEYRPEELLGEKARNVESSLCAFPHPHGQVIPVAIVTYINDGADAESGKLERAGCDSFPQLLERTKNIDPALSPDQRHSVLQFEREIQRAIDDGDEDQAAVALAKCKEVVNEIEIDKVLTTKRLDSEQSGVSLAYLLTDFSDLAIRVTECPDPTFHDIKKPFWEEGPHKIGQKRLCPRDLKKGCAFIDTLSYPHRDKATVFLSWVWSYHLLLLCEALRRWANSAGTSTSDIFFYVCFFCNNQYRILVPDAAQNGSDDLENTFAKRLQRIGNVVAVLDTWNDPVYLGRVWTIYEQHVASVHGVGVTFVLPEEPSLSMLDELDKGKKGINKVKHAITQIDAETARASVKSDEKKVKQLIQSSGGFAKVNRRVQRQMVEWIATEFKESFDASLDDNTPCPVRDIGEVAPTP